jgi:uncharacterized protein YqeY
MPTIYETLRADIIVAMKAKDTPRATILRTADAAIQRASMDLAKPIDEALALATLRKAVKNLQDAIVEFEAALRQQPNHPTAGTFLDRARQMLQTQGANP